MKELLTEIKIWLAMNEKSLQQKIMTCYYFISLLLFFAAIEEIAAMKPTILIPITFINMANVIRLMKRDNTELDNAELGFKKFKTWKD